MLNTAKKHSLHHLLKEAHDVRARLHQIHVGELCYVEKFGRETYDEWAKCLNTV